MRNLSKIFIVSLLFITSTAYSVQPARIAVTKAITIIQKRTCFSVVNNMLFNFQAAEMLAEEEREKDKKRQQEEIKQSKQNHTKTKADNLTPAHLTECPKSIICRK